MKLKRQIEAGATVSLLAIGAIGAYADTLSGHTQAKEPIGVSRKCSDCVKTEPKQNRYKPSIPKAMQGYWETSVPLQSPKFKGQYQVLMMAHIVRQYIVEQPIMVQNEDGQTVNPKQLGIITDSFNGCNASTQLTGMKRMPGKNCYRLKLSMFYWSNEYASDLKHLEILNSALLNNYRAGNISVRADAKRKRLYVNRTRMNSVPKQIVLQQMKKNRIKAYWLNPD